MATTPSTMRGDYNFTGAVSFGGGLTLPANVINNSNVIANANINGSKLQHRWMGMYEQKQGAVVVADAGTVIHMAGAAGDILDVVARIDVAPTGGDLAIQCDVERAANGSNVWATILQATIDFVDGDTDGVIRTVNLSSVVVAAFDAFRAVITVSGSTGTQGQGVTVRLQTNENASL